MPIANDVRRLADACSGFSLRSRWLPFALIAGLSGMPALAQDSEVISKIDVVGAQKLSPETVIFKAGLKVGDDLRTLDFTALLEKLWDSGAFEDIKFEVEDT
ncbi:MAG: hypothetical protein WAT51_12440, partial [Holophaga sp.]